MSDMNLNVLFEDNDITVCVKPRGLLSEDAQNGEKGIIGLLSDRAGKPLHLLHRLDRNVSGVMVFANNKKSAATLSKAIQDGRFYKEYLAITDGVPAEKSGVYKDLSDAPEAKIAQTVNPDPELVALYAEKYENFKISSKSIH